MLSAGADRFVIADTIGAANPRDVSQLLLRLGKEVGVTKLGCHFHDTRALGLANVYAALEAGVRYFDASISGIGGCPFAPGASGNVATEDIVMLLHSMGFDTGVNMKKLIDASNLAQKLLGSGSQGGRSLPWLKKYIESGRNL
jgi:hydroxymethylglutaryl-CoA lyase